MRNPFTHLPITGWYPGHMLKAGRQITQRLRLVDLVVELRDARIPQTSRNPLFNRLLKDKPRCLVLTKSDLAAPAATKKWVGILQNEEDVPVLDVDADAGRNLDRFLDLCRRTIEQHRRRTGARRQQMRLPRIMIAGIPNVGKSTLANRLAAGQKAEVGPRPGVTKAQQWVRLRSGLELLDTPGVLWPRIENKVMELKLTLVGAIKDELIGEELLADFLLWWHQHHHRPLSFSIYLKEIGADLDIDTLLQAVGRRRGLLGAGGQIDTYRAARALLHDFRAGKLGRVTFDVARDDCIL